MLSGFAIYSLLSNRSEGFVLFIVRRFLRLWPAYLVCLLGALLVRPCIYVILNAPPLGDPQLMKLGWINWNNEEAYFGWHLLTHLFMVHSAVPDTWLPGSSIALLAPAWSLSLEWQFYLLAPCLFMIIRRQGIIAWIGFSCLAGLGWLFRYSLPLGDWFPMRGFLPQQLLLFAAGMISFQLWKSWRENDSEVAGPLFALAVLTLFFTLWLPVAIWIASLACSLALSNPLKSAMNSRLLQYLGKISYSTYIGHMIIIWLLSGAMFVCKPDISQTGMLVFLCVLGMPLISFFSAILYRWVEYPAINFGKRLCLREGKLSLSKVNI